MVLAHAQESKRKDNNKRSVTLSIWFDRQREILEVVRIDHQEGAVDAVFAHNADKLLLAIVLRHGKSEDGLVEDNPLFKPFIEKSKMQKMLSAR